jgi:hypothetical protein
MSVSQADLIAIAQALKENKIDEYLASKAGVESKNDDGPQDVPDLTKPKATPSTSTGPTPSKPEQTEKDLSALEGTPRPREGLKSYNILEICSRIGFNKGSDRETSTFLPVAHRMYSILHELDDLQVQNRYFRQAIPSFLPTQTRIYYGILFLVQTMRAMNHAGILAFREQQFLSQFLALHPVATLPLAGPIMPVFQALCVSNPQDGLLPRVCPAIPAQLGPAQAQNLFVDGFSYAIPNVPLLFGLHEYIRATVVATGANPASANTILTGMGIDAPTTAQITINGVVFPIGFAAPLTANQRWIVASPGPAQPLELTDELLALFKANIRFFRPPVFNGNESIRDFGEFTRVFQGNWFSTLKRNMAIYCRFIKGSGTLQDISSEGPPAGQIISQLVTQGTLTAPPTGFFQTQIVNNAGQQESSLFPGDAIYTTSLPANDRIAELTSAYSQIHARIANHNSGQFNHIGEDGTRNGRNGSFWEVRPLQPPAMNDHVKDSLAAELSLYVRERADKD